MKKIGFILLACLLLAGCGRKTATKHNPVEVFSDDAVFAAYDRMDGPEQYTFSADAETDVSAEIITKSGELHVSIRRDGQEPVYTGNITEDFAFSVHLKESGNYFIELGAEEHAGSYRFQWNIGGDSK